MKAHIEKTKSYLGDLAGLQSKTLRAEQRILESAQERLEVVQAMIRRASAGAEAGSDKVQDRYLDLIEERGRLNIVIAKAKKNLA